MAGAIRYVPLPPDAEALNSFEEKKNTRKGYNRESYSLYLKQNVNLEYVLKVLNEFHCNPGESLLARQSSLAERLPKESIQTKGPLLSLLQNSIHQQ